MGYQSGVLEKFRLPYQQAKRVGLPPAQSDLVQLMTPNTRHIERAYVVRSVKLALLEAQLAVRAQGTGIKLPTECLFAIQGGSRFALIP